MVSNENDLIMILLSTMKSEPISKLPLLSESRRDRRVSRFRQSDGEKLVWNDVSTCEIVAAHAELILNVPETDSTGPLRN